MEFNPIIPPKNDNDNIVEVIEETSTSIIDSKKNPLAVNNLVSITIGHINDDEKCAQEYNKVKKELNSLIDKMSVKELLDYQKNLLKEREFHIECIFKAYNTAIKTEYAKHLLSPTNKDDNSNKNIPSRSKIHQMANLLKQKSI